MTADITRRACSVTIGGTSFDARVARLEVGYSSYSYDGLIAADGQITLLVDDLATIPSYQSDPDTWSKGTAVVIQVANESGVLTDVPFGGGTLYLQNNVWPDIPDPRGAVGTTLQINIVDALELFRFRTPEVNRTETENTANPEIVLTRHKAINDYLAYAGLTGNVSGLSYALDRPVPKTDNGSIVDFCGAIAESANAILYSNGTEINSKAVELGSSIKTLTIGVDESAFQPANEAEIPPQELIVSGESYTAINPNATNTTQQSFSASRESIFSERRGDATLIPYLTITRTDYGFANNQQRIEVSYAEPRGRVLPAFGADEIQIFSKQEYETEFFDSDGRRTTFTTSVREPKGKIFPEDFPTAQNLILGEAITITYQHDENNPDIVVSRITSKQQIIARAFPDYIATVGFSEQLVVLESTVESWNEPTEDSDEWDYRIGTYKPRTLVNPVDFPDFDTTLVVVPSSNPSLDNKQAPPKAKYRRADREYKPTPIKAVISTRPNGNAPQVRQRVLRLDHVVSEAQLIAYGERYVAMVYGRGVGFDVEVPIFDEWFSFTPLSAVTIIWNGSTYECWVDAPRFLVEGSRAVVQFSAIPFSYDSGAKTFLRTVGEINIVGMFGGSATPINDDDLQIEIVGIFGGSADPLGFYEIDITGIFGGSALPVTDQPLGAEILGIWGGSANPTQQLNIREIDITGIFGGFTSPIQQLNITEIDITGIFGGSASPLKQPDLISNLELWLDASDSGTITQSGLEVTNWNDKSSNINHATAVSGKRPEVNGTLNSKNLVYFEGGDEMTLTSDIPITGAHTFFMVLKPPTDITASTTDGDVLMWHEPYPADASDFAGFVFTGNIVNQYTSETLAFSAVTSAGQHRGRATSNTLSSSGFIVAVTWSGAGNQTIYINGTNATGGVPTLGELTGAYPMKEINAFGSSSTPGQTKAGMRFAEILVYSRALTAEEINTVGVYLTDNWGIAWNTIT